MSFPLNAQPGDITVQFIDPNIPTEVRAQILGRLGVRTSPEFWRAMDELISPRLRRR